MIKLYYKENCILIIYISQLNRNSAKELGRSGGGGGGKSSSSKRESKISERY